MTRERERAQAPQSRSDDDQRSNVQTFSNITVWIDPFIGRKRILRTASGFGSSIDPKVAGARERFEAFARSVRDVLAAALGADQENLEGENAKRIYYLSMEFLIGRSLANNVTNLLSIPFYEMRLKKMVSTGLNWSSQEPDRAGQARLGPPRGCFLDSRHHAAPSHGPRYSPAANSRHNVFTGKDICVRCGRQ